MYDRAPRNLTGTTGNTAEHVGPGTYDSDSVDPKKLRADGYAPFSSMTSRESFLNPNDNVIAAPGPGQYDPVFPQDMVLGGRIMDNKAKRFKETTASETPGPGAYTLSTRKDWIKETGRKTSSSAPSDGKGLLMTNRIKFHRQEAPPSIPAPGQAYGYEENNDGTLRKQDPPDKDKSMGPAYYNVDHNDPTPSQLYRGIHFGRMTSKRMDFCGKEGPGPGEYEPFLGHKLDVEHTNMTEKTTFESKLPRYHELIAEQEKKKAVPGPGKYTVKGTFDPHPPKVNTEGMEVEHPPFGSQAKRFGLIKTQTPSPGTYNDPRTALDSLKKITGLKRSPFGQTSVRFDHGRRKTPGPGSYNLSGMGSDSMKRAYIESTRRGAFGTTSVRIQPMIKRTEVELPGPSHYQVKDKIFQPRYQQLSSNFASLSNRLSEPPTIVKEIPPPGSYEVHKSFKSTQDKKMPCPPRSESGKKKQGAFKSSSSRFAPPRDVVLEETDPNYPGPGTYNPRLRGAKGNPMVAQETRFKQPKHDEVPGPGTYQFSPLVQDTVLKGTFNATLNNPITPKMDNLHGNMSANQPFLLGV